jgi:hypothetical protein
MTFLTLASFARTLFWLGKIEWRFVAILSASLAGLAFASSCIPLGQ